PSPGVSTRARTLAAIGPERVLTVRHWTDTQFSFTTTRDRGLRFENGQFVMVGLAVDSRPVLRAYSIASANHEEHLEFLSIKVPNGPLTSRLQHVRAGDEVLVSRKPTGTLLLQDLRPGKRLYLLSTGTGAAPFMSLIKDPEVYERFEHVVFVHGVRWARETAVVRHRIEALRAHELLGAEVRAKLHYYPAVTRDQQARVAQGVRQLCLDARRLGAGDTLQMQGRPAQHLEPTPKNAAGGANAGLVLVEALRRAVVTHADVQAVGPAAAVPVVEQH